MMDAHTQLDADRFERWRDFIAVMVAHLMNATGNFSEDLVTADKLLGRHDDKLIKKLKADKAKNMKQPKGK